MDPVYTPELHTDLEEISEDECLQLLDRHKLGRLAIVVAGQPLIFPVNYALSQRVVTFRTAAGTKLANAPGTNVAFEIDEYDASTRVGWSVLVQGVAVDARDIADVLHARVKNSRRLGEVSVSTVPQLALLFRGFTGAPSPNATPRRRRIA